MKPVAVEKLVKEQLFPLWRAEHERLEVIDRWYRWQHEEIVLPRDASRELKRLRDLAKTPWLGLVVTTVAQSLYVDGYTSSSGPAGADDPSGPWRTWTGNDMESRQVALHRAALAYGVSYATVLPGAAPDGSAMSVIRGRSPRKMLAVYGDQANDDWPMFAIDVESQGHDTWAVLVYDEVNRYRLTVEKDGDKVTFIEPQEHGAQVCPVVRYTNMLDLDGRTDGDVEPFISVAARLNKTTLDRLLIQHFSSWKVRTVAGLAIPDEDEEKARQKFKLRHDDLLVAEDPDTKFGTLPETPLDGIIRAHDTDVKTLAAVSQTPTTALSGDLINLSADGIVAARASFKQKVIERQKAFRKAHNQTLRLAMSLEGNEAAAADLSGKVTWQDPDIQSMSQAVDALGKAAQMLQIPAQGLWEKIPGVEQSDVDEWKRLAASGDAMATLLDTIGRQAAPPSGGQ